MVKKILTKRAWREGEKREKREKREREKGGGWGRGVEIKRKKKTSSTSISTFSVERENQLHSPFMSSLGLVADRWRVVTTAAGDACVLGSGGHAEVYLVEDEGRSKSDGASSEGGSSVVVGDERHERPRKEKKPRKKKKRYALKIDKRASAGCIGTVRHETEVIRSLEGVPGVVRLAPELEHEEEEEGEEDEARGGEHERDEKARDGRSKKRRRRRPRSTVSGTLSDGRSWVVMELLGANLAEASVAAGAVAPRSGSSGSGRRREGDREGGGGAASKDRGGGGDGGEGGSPREGGTAAAAVAEEEEEEEEEEPGGDLSPPSWTADDVRAAASSALAALAAIHAAGWVHRDVKPANFALSLPDEEDGEDDEAEDDDSGGGSAGDNGGGCNSSRAASSNPSRRWVAIDFGLSTRFLDAGGNVLPPRPPERRKSRDAAAFPPPAPAPASAAPASAAAAPESVVLFRGSTTYASPAAHSGRDASRRDDLWSWVYAVSELVAGTLPWREGRRRGGASLGEAKAAARERASAWKRAVAADPEALMAIGGAGSGEGFPLPKAPGVVVGGGTEQQQQQQLQRPRPACPPALARAARHVASLGFKDAPDYSLLAQCAAELPGPMRGGGEGGGGGGGGGGRKRVKGAAAAAEGAEAAEEEKVEGAGGGTEKG